MSECSFSLKHYRDTLIRYQDSGYVYLSMLDDPLSYNKSIVMSHDVDFDPALALNMARMEFDLGVKSTYFFRLGAKYYNLLSQPAKEAVDNISKMGHGVGLHLESIGLNSILEEEHVADLLQICNRWVHPKFEYFNVHEPARTSVIFGEITESLGSKDRRPILSKHLASCKYISDSGARWREGCFCQHIDRHKKLLVLTHPFWWYKNSPCENY